MRFTSNSFLVSTVALLSLMTPVVNANSFTITSPSSGQILPVFSSINVVWTILDDGQGPQDNILCEIGLLHDQDAPDAPEEPNILQSGVSLLSGQSNGLVSIPELEARKDYFMQLQLPNGTVFAKSSHFSIVFPP